MKTTILMTIFLALNVLITSAQNCPAPVPVDAQALSGTWKGTCSISGQLHEMTIEFKEAAGVLSTFVTIPGQKINRKEFITDICDSQDIHFQAAAGKDNFEFIGKPRGQTMSGRLEMRDASGMFAEEIFSVRKQGRLTSVRN